MRYAVISFPLNVDEVTGFGFSICSFRTIVLQKIWKNAEIIAPRNTIMMPILPNGFSAGGIASKKSSDGAFFS